MTKDWKKQIEKKRLCPTVVKRVESLIQKLRKGCHWSHLGGYRLHGAVVFKLPSAHRLVCQFNGEALRCYEAMPHQEYDSFASNTRR